MLEPDWIILFSSLEPSALLSFSDQICPLSVVVVVVAVVVFTISTKLSTKGEGNSSLFKWRTTAFPRDYNYEIAKIHKHNLKIFLYRTAWPILTKLSTKHPWVKKIQVCSIEGPRPFPRGDYNEIAKNNWRLLFFYFRTTWLF